MHICFCHRVEIRFFLHMHVLSVTCQKLHVKLQPFSPDDAIAWQVVRAASVQMNGKVQDTTECWSCQLCEGIKCVCMKA